MRHPIGEQKGLLLGEVAVVKDEQKFAAVALDSLDRVRDARRKIPEVALADVVLEGATVLVDGGDPRPAFEHVGPLGRFVPVHFPDTAGLEPHIDTGDLGGDGQLARRRLPSPAALRDMVVAVRERPS